MAVEIIPLKSVRGMASHAMTKEKLDNAPSEISLVNTGADTTDSHYLPSSVETLNMTQNTLTETLS